MEAFKGEKTSSVCPRISFSDVHLDMKVKLQP